MKFKQVLDVNKVITHLLQVGKKKTDKQMTLSEWQVRQLCLTTRQIFLEQPMLLELEPPVNIVGDIHGQFDDLLRHFDKLGYPPEANYLFLGDYVDRGKNSLETICLLLAYKIKFPNNFFLLRGNHECASINRIYGFYDECKRRYTVKLWKTFTDLFNCLPVESTLMEASPSLGLISTLPLTNAAKLILPSRRSLLAIPSSALLLGVRCSLMNTFVVGNVLTISDARRTFFARTAVSQPSLATLDTNCTMMAALIEGTIFCMHGGLSPQLVDLNQIRTIPRPLDVPDSGLVCDLLWGDPDEGVMGWGQNDRGVSYVFGGDVVRSFLRKHNCSLIVRAHQVVEDGYQFFSRRNLLTLFSAPNYCGEFDNAGAVMSVSEDLTCCFSILPPEKKKTIKYK